jgi:hypothetical protein
MPANVWLNRKLFVISNHTAFPRFTLSGLISGSSTHARSFP